MSKKKIILLIIMVLIILTIFIKCFFINNNQHKNNSESITTNTEKNKEDMKEKIKNQIDNLNKNINTNDYDLIKNNVYEKLSNYMKEKYLLYDIYIINSQMNKISIYRNQSNNTLADINYTYSFIILRNTTDLDRRTVEHTFFHELGHALDTYDESDNYKEKTTGKYSKTDKFNDIFKHEKYNLQYLSKEHYFMDEVNEYFAECFDIYMENPTKMKEVAPKTYEFIDTVSNK